MLFSLNRAEKICIFIKLLVIFQCDFEIHPVAIRKFFLKEFQLFSFPLSLANVPFDIDAQNVNNSE